MPTIFAALTSGLKDVRAERGGNSVVSGSRVERDLPMTTVVIGSLVIVAMMWALLTFKPVPGAQTSAFANVIAAVFVVIFGFLFVTVSSRICGLIGTSANPVSGMTIATLMATCAMFLALGWTGSAFAVLALTIGGVVCIASANAGATSQDLKTGFLVGATPMRQQLGLMIGVMASVFVIGFVLLVMNVGLARYQPLQIPLDIAQVRAGQMEGVKIEADAYEHAGKTYVLVNSIGSRQVPDGKYLFDSATNQIEIQWETGIGGAQAAAPQARLMATIINGILTQRLPWRLVLLGVFLVVAVELLGIRSLSFAVGSYLSIATTLAIFTGGVVRWIVERGAKKAGGAHEESEVSPGSLYASGLIAAGGVIGLLAIFINLLSDPEIPRQLPQWLSFLNLPWFRADLFSLGPKFLPGLSASPFTSVVMFLLLAASLFHFARKKLD